MIKCGKAQIAPGFKIRGKRPRLLLDGTVQCEAALAASSLASLLSNGIVGFAAGGSSSDRKRSRPIRALLGDAA